MTLLMVVAFGWSIKTSMGISKSMAVETTTLGEMARDVLMAANEVSRMSESLAQGDSPLTERETDVLAAARTKWNFLKFCSITNFLCCIRKFGLFRNI